MCLNTIIYYETVLLFTSEIALEGEHWRRCVYYTNKALGFVTGAAYVHATSGIGSVKKVRLIKIIVITML